MTDTTRPLIVAARRVLNLADDIDIDGPIVFAEALDKLAAALAEAEAEQARRDDIRQLVEQSSLGDVVYAEIRERVDPDLLYAIEAGAAQADRADRAEAELAAIKDLIGESVKKVLDVAGPDDQTPAIQRLRNFEGGT